MVPVFGKGFDVIAVHVERRKVLRYSVLIDWMVGRMTYVEEISEITTRGDKNYITYACPGPLIFDR